MFNDPPVRVVTAGDCPPPSAGPGAAQLLTAPPLRHRRGRVSRFRVSEMIE